MQPKVLKYLLDIESVINEIELIKTKCNNSFMCFNRILFFNARWNET